jgi:hypothetical protein
MLLLQLGLRMDARGGRLVAIVIAPAAHQRSRGGDQAGDDREGERLVQACAERPRDQVREERASGKDSVLGQAVELMRRLVDA